MAVTHLTRDAEASVWMMTSDVWSDTVNAGGHPLDFVHRHKPVFCLGLINIVFQLIKMVAAVNHLKICQFD